MDHDEAAPLRLSVLDQSPVVEGGTGAQALRNSVDLAVLADRLGYHRYWVAEHHATPLLACGAPEILIGAVASATSRIRVGSGGVLLSHYSPFKVAEQFSVLCGLYGTRIDLGLGKAPGAGIEAAIALQRDRSKLPPEDFEDQLGELLAYFEGTVPHDHPFARIAQLPGAPGTPEVWLLGTSPASAGLAAAFGLPYAVADFITPGAPRSGARYRELFQPSPRLGRPEVIVAVAVVCAETDAEAERHASSWRMALTNAERGRPAALPSVSRAQAFLAGETGDTFMGRRVVVGGPDTVRAALEAIAAEATADEILVHTMTHEHDARRRSYELLAEAFGLTGAARPAHAAVEPHAR